MDSFVISPLGQAIWTIALARTERLPEARSRAAMLPADCAICLTARGVVASVEGDIAGSDRWFAQASRLDAEEPLPELTWGRAAKFAEAARLAPRWGRLHLKWGEALARIGKAADARSRFAAPATMDLTDAERAELAAQRV